jgi:tetratricopeptide (TPR) repeat protein
MPSNASSLPETSAVTDLLAVRTASHPKIKTRKLAPWMGVANDQGLIHVDNYLEARPSGASLVTHRPARQRRNQVLKAIGVVIGLFPPVWPVYLGGWLFWRSRPPHRSMRQVHKALRALEKGQTGIALKQLQEAHYLDPSNNDALYWLGMLLSKQHRQEEAIDALSLVSERVPVIPEVEAALVDAYVATGESEAAVYHAQQLLDIAPYLPETPLKLADAFEAAGQLGLAIEALERAPLHKRVLTEPLVQIHYRLGDLYERQGLVEKALHHFKTVYARDISFRDVRSRVMALETSKG